jgi:hypothetical protein
MYRENRECNVNRTRLIQWHYGRTSKIECVNLHVSVSVEPVTPLALTTDANLLSRLEPVNLAKHALGETSHQQVLHSHRVLSAWDNQNQSIFVILCVRKYNQN